MHNPGVFHPSLNPLLPCTQMRVIFSSYEHEVFIYQESRRANANSKMQKRAARLSFQPCPSLTSELITCATTLTKSAWEMADLYRSTLLCANNLLIRGWPCEWDFLYTYRLHINHCPTSTLPLPILKASTLVVYSRYIFRLSSPYTVQNA